MVRAAPRAFLMNLLTVLGAAGLGIAIVAAAPSSLSTKHLAIPAIGIALSLGLLVGQLWRLVFCAWIVLIPYFRTYSLRGTYTFTFTNDFFWTVADLALIALAVLSTLTTSKRPPLRGIRPWILFLPFLFSSCVSLLFAGHLDWAAIELWRLSKVLLILYLIDSMVQEEEWWLAIGSLAITVIGQSAFALVQVAVPRFHFILGGESNSRGAGTLGHPNDLSSYLILLWPLLLGVAGVLQGNRWRLLFFASSILGVCGIFASQSRAAIAACAVQFVLVGIAAIAAHLLSAKRVIGVFSVACVLAGIAAVLFIDKIEARLNRGNLEESLDFRSRLNTVAIEMATAYPFFGVGLRNFSEHVKEFGAGDHFDETLIVNGPDTEDITIEKNRIPVHNLYLLLLAETGLIGLGTFLFWVGGGLVMCIRKLRAAAGAPQSAVAAGISIGMTGILLHQFTEFTLWSDPGLYTLALVYALLFKMPSSFPQLQANPEPSKALAEV